MHGATAVDMIEGTGLNRLLCCESKSKGKGKGREGYAETSFGMLYWQLQR